MTKRIYLYLAISLIHVGGVSQMCDTTIHPNGWKEILLGDSFQSVESYLIPYNRSELKNIAHATPLDAWFVYKNSPYACEQLKSVIFLHILVATGPDSNVRQIKIYIKDSANALYNFLQKKFGDPSIGSSSISNSSLNRHYIWKSENDILLHYLRPKETFGFAKECNVELTFSFMHHANEFREYLVWPRFNIE